MVVEISRECHHVVPDLAKFDFEQFILSSYISRHQESQLPNRTSLRGFQSDDQPSLLRCTSIFSCKLEPRDVPPSNPLAISNEAHHRSRKISTIRHTSFTICHLTAAMHREKSRSDLTPSILSQAHQPKESKESSHTGSQHKPPKQPSVRSWKGGWWDKWSTVAAANTPTYPHTHTETHY
jgi:hypothetical protein